MPIQMCTLRFIVQLRGEVSIWEVNFTLFLEPIRAINLEKSGKNPQNYTVEKNESFVLKQKSIEIDMFNDDEEK